MSTIDAEQLALDGLAPRRRRRRSASQREPAAELPIARVVLDVQATHLGQTFDYLVDEKDADAACPGALVRVRFGGQRVSGVIWARVASSDTAASALRYLERVISSGVVVPASLRDDIEAIADAYGGTRANILRLAVPPRVARVEAEQRLVTGFARGSGAGGLGANNISASGISANDIAASSRGHVGMASDAGVGRNAAANALNGGSVLERLDAETQEYSMRYGRWAGELSHALSGGGFRSFVIDALPGVGEGARALAWMAASTLAAGRSAVVVLPGIKETEDLLAALGTLGLTRFAPSKSSNGAWRGDVAVLNASLPPADRYRAYLAVASGQVRCVIGSRAAMYAPIEGPGLFAIMDDAAYQQADGMMPYAQARGVLRLRARSHGGVFVALANARSALSHWEVSDKAIETGVSGPSELIRPLPSVVGERRPWIRWLNRDELARLADSSIGARVPHTAVANIRQALSAGPVLFSIPADGVSEALSCASCLRQARCPRCAGPLETPPGMRAPRCRWCGVAATNWACPHCHGERLRVIRVGAAGTAAELQGLFRGVRIMLSSPSQPGGVIRRITHAPVIVIATPGAEPRVDSLGRDGIAGEYAAVAILDAWTSLYKPGVDARIDTLADWMRAVSLCAPRERGGQALLIGESDPALAQALMLWDPGRLAEHELAERAETGLPPLVTAACVWGRRDAVGQALRHVGALGGDLALCLTPAGDLPGVLGPVPIPQPRTVDARELEGTADRVKAVVRVPHQARADLALRLRDEVSRHVAAREPGELRFQLDPKDLI